MLSDQEVMKNGFSDPERMLNMQKSLVAERIVTNTKLATMQDVANSMALQFPGDIAEIPNLAEGL